MPRPKRMRTTRSSRGVSDSRMLSRVSRIRQLATSSGCWRAPKRIATRKSAEVGPRFSFELGQSSAASGQDSNKDDEGTNRRNDRRLLGFCQSMTERQKVTTAKLLAIIESEFSRLFGRSVRDYMPRVRLHARAGEPNWNAEISGDIGISVLGPFLVALDRVKSQYDLDDHGRERLIARK